METLEGLAAQVLGGVEPVGLAEMRHQRILVVDPAVGVRRRPLLGFLDLFLGQFLVLLHTGVLPREAGGLQLLVPAQPSSVSPVRPVFQ